MILLPTIHELKRRCQALAALDLILSPEWDYRLFSFNAGWAEGEQMASMRNGSGDEWFCLFHSSGWCALKGLDHESKAWADGREKLSAALRGAIPESLTVFSAERAFRWDSTSFAFYRLRETDPWVRVADSTEFARLMPTGEEEHLALLFGPPEEYAAAAQDYLERDIEVGVVRDIFDLLPITPAIASRLNPEADWAAVATELFSEIGYPR